ncbi:unnamed protein product [Phytomonas sp. EM1]|nr:unnamed protein product [Phytomonas sp. EM1]|eukprot:CCW61059.1 unnamed protein product [Phytomonas sp. isolate EM1]
MLKDLIERENSVETITSFNTGDSCSTVSPRSSEDDLEPPEPADLHGFPFVSAHAYALRGYDVQAVDSNAVDPHPTSSVTLTLRWGFSAPRAHLPTTNGGSFTPSSGSSPMVFREGLARLVFPLPEEAVRWTDRRLALVLAVNRDLISKCASLPPQQWKSGGSNEEAANAGAKECLHGLKSTDLASLPREGMQLTLYFTQREMLSPPNVKMSSDPHAQPYLCQSFDLVSFTTEGTEALCGVPLKPFHRYHLKYHPERGIELNLNKHFVLHLFDHSKTHLGKKECVSAPVHPNVAFEVGKRVSKRPRKNRVSGEASRTSVGAAALAQGGTRPPRKRSTVQRAPLPPPVEHSSIDSFPPFSSESGKSDEVVRAPLLRRRRVLFTTGLRLNPSQERACAGLGFVMNPSLAKAREASILVVQAPLMRSVKLLTVLPYINALVDRRWLDDVLTQGNPQLPVEPYAYAENKREGGIEHTNGFSIERTLRIPLEQRQRLFAEHVFWIHPSAAPQEPPMNDLHSVLTASGGKISKSITEASIWVLPSRTPSVASLKFISKTLMCEEIANQRRYPRRTAVSEDEVPLSNLLSSSVGIVVPDDIFRSVLQQEDLGTFALQISSIASKLVLTNTKKRICTPQRKAAIRVSENTTGVSMH